MNYDIVIRIRRPVKRERAEHYLLLTLLSFGGSVIVTRFFLQVTGYPQVGNGVFHIAHVLWGGLLLFYASLLPLLIANRWVFTASSLLGGIGVGLFIDEVGKFITQSNDYFFPLAAPIIYAFFLVTVLIYLRVRQPAGHDPRSEMYRALEALQEVLEHDLDIAERSDLENRLHHIATHKEDPAISTLAVHLDEFLETSALQLVPRQETMTDRLLATWRHVEAKYITRNRLRAVLAGGLLALGLLGLVGAAQAVPFGPSQHTLENMMYELIRGGRVTGVRTFGLFLTNVGLEFFVGLLYIASAGLLIANRDRQGIAVGSWGLLLSLVMVDLLTFYFDQFSTILAAIIQFSLFWSAGYYRRHYLPPTGFKPQPMQIPDATDDTRPEDLATPQEPEADIRRASRPPVTRPPDGGFDTEDPAAHSDY